MSEEQARALLAQLTHDEKIMLLEFLNSLPGE